MINPTNYLWFAQMNTKVNVFSILSALNYHVAVPTKTTEEYK